MMSIIAIFNRHLAHHMLCHIALAMQDLVTSLMSEADSAVVGNMQVCTCAWTARHQDGCDLQVHVRHSAVVTFQSLQATERLHEGCIKKRMIALEHEDTSYMLMEAVKAGQRFELHIEVCHTTANRLLVDCSALQQPQSVCTSACVPLREGKLCSSPSTQCYAIYSRMHCVAVASNSRLCLINGVPVRWSSQLQPQKGSHTFSLKGSTKLTRAVFHPQSGKQIARIMTVRTR